MPIVVTEAGSFVSTQIGLILNPTSDGFPAQLDISSGAYGPKQAAFPPPNPSPAYASSYDTEGSIATDAAHYDNREITIGLWVVGNSSSAVEQSLNALYKMVGQINREGGVLKFTSPAQTVCYFDLVPEAGANLTVDHMYLWKNRAEVELRLVARPFWRGAEVDLGTTSETTLPALVATYTGVDGDVRALVEATITDGSGNSQSNVLIGGDSRYYSNAATAALFYQAEDLTPLGTSTDTAGAAGASGTNVIRNTDLTTTYQAILKSEIDATNAALTHKDTLRICARLYRPTSNTGAVSVKLEWAEGDFTRVARNDDNVVAFDVAENEGQWLLVDLGVVSISPDSARWEFRLLAKSTVPGDELDADCFMLFPTEVTYAKVSGKTLFETPSSPTARDEFGQTVTGGSDPLTGLTAPVGGVWTGGGDTDDFVVEDTGHTAQRTAVSDTGRGRYALSGASAATTVAVQADVKSGRWGTTAAQYLGVIARYVDATNWVRGVILTDGSLIVEKMIAGSVTTISSSSASLPTPTGYVTLRLLVAADGRFWLWAFPQGTPSTSWKIAGQDGDLATGGTLASGTFGIVDDNQTAGADTRNYDNFLAFVPTLDAAIFASQSLTVRHDGATREDSTGTFSSPIVVDGPHLKIPPAGPEGRTTRLIVAAQRGPELRDGVILDPASDDISIQLSATPRGLVVPEA